MYVTGLCCHTLRKEEMRMHVSPGLLARLGPTIVSMVALAHAHVPRLVICPYEVRAANERRWST